MKDRLPMLLRYRAFVSLDVVFNRAQRPVSAEHSSSDSLERPNYPCHLLALYWNDSSIVFFSRFTSPDEFTGGPEELYFFVDHAAANPTFYAAFITRNLSININTLTTTLCDTPIPPAAVRLN